MTDTGWQVYPNAVFAANRKSVTLILEDGGAGDEDGVVNGVIVDPSGVAYTESDSASLSTNGPASGVSNGSECFIATGSSDIDASTCRFSIIGLLLLIALGAGLQGVYQLKRIKA
jgi:hypothetical protein